METILRKAQEINFLLKHTLRVGANLEKIGNRILTEYGLNQQQFIVLNEISRSSNITANQIVTELGYEKSNISKMIKKLKILKYILSAENKNDKRSTFLNTTKTGQKVQKRCIDILNKENTTMFKNINIEEIIAMKESTSRLSKIIFKEI